MPTTFRPYQPDQMLLLAPDLRDWVAQGHLAHHVSDLVDSLDLSAFYAPYEGDGRRNAPYEPSMMVRFDVREALYALLGVDLTQIQLVRAVGAQMIALSPVTAADAERMRFYRERDARRIDYLESDWAVDAAVSVEAGDDACSTPAGQLVLLTLVNQLMRFHRIVRVSISDPDAAMLVPGVCGGTSLGHEMVKLASRIDPYGQFRVDTQAGGISDVSIGVGGACRKGLSWYLGIDRCTAELATSPLSLGYRTGADLRGAGVAAILGAAAAMKTVLGLRTVPRRLSVWNLQEGDLADAGPPELPSVDVGRTLMIGSTAATASATVRGRRPAVVYMTTILMSRAKPIGIAPSAVAPMRAMTLTTAMRAQVTARAALARMS